MTEFEELVRTTVEKNQMIAELKTQIEELRKELGEGNKAKVEREYKDRLFKFIFGNPEHKAWTLSLYNAINGTNYTNPEDIQFNTLGDVVYMKMKNDTSFIIYFVMNLWEHQSSYNPNMPMRFFIYGGALYDKYATMTRYYRFSSKLQKIPRPKCVCFYNGTVEQPEQQVLNLSDAYEGEGDIEVRVTMLNINHGKNAQLMEACKPLQEYALLVDAVRRHEKEKMDLETAIDLAINELPDEFVIKEFIVGNQAEVKKMFLTEYDEKKEMELEKQEGIDIGIDMGIDMGIDLERERIAKTMLKNKEPIQKIVEYSNLSDALIRSIAKQSGFVLAEPT